MSLRPILHIPCPHPTAHSSSVCQAVGDGSPRNHSQLSGDFIPWLLHPNWLGGQVVSDHLACGMQCGCPHPGPTKGCVCVLGTVLVSPCSRVRLPVAAASVSPIVLAEFGSGFFHGSSILPLLAGMHGCSLIHTRFQVVALGCNPFACQSVDCQCLADWSLPF